MPFFSLWIQFSLETNLMLCSFAILTLTVQKYQNVFVSMFHHTQLQEITVFRHQSTKNILQQCITASGKNLYKPSATCSEEEEKITKPPSLGCALFNQVSNFVRAPFAISKATLGAPFSILLGNFGRAPLQSVRQQTTTSTLHLDFPSHPHIAQGSSPLYCVHS